jgi:son of sevenless
MKITIQECQKLRNFSSMFAIVAGIDSPEVTHLTLTYQRLPAPERSALKSMTRLMEWTDNHGEYRKVLAKSEIAIPYLGAPLYVSIFGTSDMTISRDPSTRLPESFWKNASYH